ncbi:MAG: hypothetical protein JJ975_05080 [Bacteroidia bacterium]|nr:hypothetical protein [Bacteroidia bacterium]
MGRFTNTYLPWLLIVTNCILVAFNQSTYDDGDSVVHYLLSKQALSHPHQFLNFWAKPLFVLLSAPFTYLGFWGMKLFNTLCILGATAFAHRIWKLFYDSNPLVFWVLAFFSPHIFLSQSSGLTEPLFAFVLIVGIYYTLREHYIPGLILLSFLPYVRSEGWVLMVVFVLSLLFLKQWKHLLWLTVGTLVYGIVGQFALDDFFWMFHQNPYSGVESKYGNGNLFHFVHQLPYLIGWPVFALLSIGVVLNVWNIVKNRMSLSAYHYFVLGSFMAILVAHSIFWYMGWFHSFGLKRVLLAVFPCMLLLAAEGFSLLTSRLPKKLGTSLLLLIVVLFPFSGNKAGFHLPADVQLTTNQEAVKLASAWYKESQQPTVVSFGSYYFAEILNVDIDDTNEMILINGVLEKTIPSGSLVFWDDYFCPSDRGVLEEDIRPDEYDYVRDFVFSRDGKSSRIAVFRKR